MKDLFRGILREPLFWIMALFGLVLYLLSSCTKPEPLEPTLTKRAVQQGKSDFLPNHTWLPGEARTIEGLAKFHTSMWYDNLGADQSDWNKLIGVYHGGLILRYAIALSFVCTKTSQAQMYRMNQPFLKSKRISFSNSHWKN